MRTFDFLICLEPFKKLALEKIMKKYIFLFLVVCINSVNAAPIVYNFSQAGFDEGASVTGMFTGEDLNGDGQLSNFDPDNFNIDTGEITDFIMDFSGNSLVSPFSLGFADLHGFAYDLDGGF